MKEYETIRKSFDFLREKAQNDQTFTTADLSAATGWTTQTTGIYLSKKFSELITKSTGGNLRANRDILDVTYDKFSALFKQKNTLFSRYTAWTHPDVTTYEFFLPLSCEDVLRAALDRLFYKDTVVHRLKQIGLQEIRLLFPQNTGEAETDFLNRVATFAENKIAGYSISHVSGRFRATDLLTRSEATQLENAGGQYIIDETTAIVRFILPHSATATKQGDQILPLEDQAINEEVKKTAWIFNNLFVHAVTQATTNQDEIWLLETGKNHRLFRYVSED